MWFGKRKTSAKSDQEMSVFEPLLPKSRLFIQQRIYYQLIVAWKQTCQEARIIFTLNFCKLLFRSTKGLLAKQIITFAFSNSSFRIIVNHYVEYAVCLKYFKVRTKLSLLKIKVDHYLLKWMDRIQESDYSVKQNFWVKIWKIF